MKIRDEMESMVFADLHGPASGDAEEIDEPSVRSCTRRTQIWFSIKKRVNHYLKGEQEREQIRTKTEVFEGSREKRGARKPQKTRGKRKW
jgi:hypothetical protein